MGITVLTIVILGGKSWVLWSPTGFSVVCCNFAWRFKGKVRSSILEKMLMQRGA